MRIQELQEFLYREYQANGYPDSFNKYQKMGDIAELGLITTEIAEAIEECRIHGVTSFENLYTECADIIIRTMNFMTRKGCIDIESVIYAKTLKNMKRGELHGKSV